MIDSLFIPLVHDTPVPEARVFFNWNSWEWTDWGLFIAALLLILAMAVILARTE